MPGGGDWSGRPGHLCDYCGRSSANVGPRRGFDYINDVCGGCCALSSDDDGNTEENHCRKCKRLMSSYGSVVNCAPTSYLATYCGDCVKRCKLCGDVVHPYREVDKYSVPLDNAIKDIIDEDDYSIDRLGETAKHGETIYLCNECHKTKWKRHPNCGKPFPGYTAEEIHESAYDGEYKRQAFRNHCTVEDVNASTLDDETKRQILQNYYTVEEINQSALDDETKRQVLQNQQKGN